MKEGRYSREERLMKKLFGVFLVLSVLAASPAWCASDAPRKARAVIAPTQGNAVSGKLVFIRLEKGVRIRGKIKGLVPNGDHGFHIHEKGDCSSPDAMSAGGHFNPSHADHGGLETAQRHLGDLGNLRADKKGVAKVDLVRTDLSFDGNDSILGRSVMVHAKADDFKTQPSGASGARTGCGVIQPDR
jgi:Cu-Zn family superoxide dismutase